MSGIAAQGIEPCCSASQPEAIGKRGSSLGLLHKDTRHDGSVGVGTEWPVSKFAISPAFQAEPAENISKLDTSQGRRTCPINTISIACILASLVEDRF